MDNLDELLLETRTAVLVVDVQNDYCHPDGALAKIGSDVSGAGEMIPHLQHFLDSARALGQRIIFVQTIHDASTDSEIWKARSNGHMSEVCRPESWGSRFYQIAPESGEIVVHKHKYSAFINTKLDSVLRAHKIETLLIAGVATNVCVESTARDAFMMDYRVVLLQDACAAFSAQAHQMALENISGYFGMVAKTGEVIRIWNKAAVNRIPQGNLSLFHTV